MEGLVLVVGRTAGYILPPERGQLGPLRPTLVDRLLRREDRLQLEKVRSRRDLLAALDKFEKYFTIYFTTQY